MNASERDLDAVDAPDAPDAEVPLCLSCGEPRDERQDFCSRCGAPGSTAATAGAYETIRAWGWALGESGRWGWTRRAAAIIAVAWCGGWIYLLLETVETPSSGVEWLSFLWLAGGTLLHVLVLLYLVRRWWRLRGTPDPRAPDDDAAT